MVLRLLGTVVGSTVGFAVMYGYTLATNPFGIAAIVAAIALLMGMASTHQYRMAAILGHITLIAVILCQYTGETVGEGCTTWFSI